MVLYSQKRDLMPTPPGLVSTSRTTTTIVGCEVDSVTWSEALETIRSHAKRRAGAWVSLCNVHSVVTSSSDAALRDAINGSILASPDGMPLVWILRKRGVQDQERISGLDLMLRLCDAMQASEESIYLYGSTQDTLDLLAANLNRDYCELTVAGTMSPPFRDLSDAETQQICDEINASGAGIVFVGLGCPKQEVWMANNSHRINAVLIGVGAAFDYHAGTLKRAPKWARDIGLEWFVRLLSEPRRLFKRYFATNTKFLAKYLPELLRVSRRGL
jgi:N-acetylglucosaminyldiphosphoundecaprenol N-acetyl-beta-D-mannosaminyltransferase